MKEYSKPYFSFAVSTQGDVIMASSFVVDGDDNYMNDSLIDD